MTNQKPKKGRPAGAARLTEAERDVIRMGAQIKTPVAQIARMIGRGNSTVYNAIVAMTADGSIRQCIIDLGKLVRAADERP